MKISCQRFEEICVWISETERHIAEADYDDWISHAEECANCRNILENTCNRIGAPDPLAERIFTQVAVLERLAAREGMTVQDLPDRKYENFNQVAGLIIRKWDEVKTVN